MSSQKDLMGKILAASDEISKVGRKGSGNWILISNSILVSSLNESIRRERIRKIGKIITHIKDSKYNDQLDYDIAKYQPLMRVWFTSGKSNINLYTFEQKHRRIFKIQNLLQNIKNGINNNKNGTRS